MAKASGKCASTGAWTDGEVFGSLVNPIEGTSDQIDGDGAYDTRETSAVAAARDAKLIVPPREIEAPWDESHPRNAALEQIAAQGLAEWKQASGYYRRSIAENAMYRLKQLFRDRLASRRFDTQVTEVHARVEAMNVMT